MEVPGKVARRPEDYLGVVVEGSHSRGLRLRLDEKVAIEDLRVGQFVVIESGDLRFFGLVTDLELGSAGVEVLQDPPSAAASALLAQVVQGTSTFGYAAVRPTLAMVPGQQQPGPVRSIPRHFAPSYRAEELDFATVFGTDDGKGATFAIGRPLDMDIDVCLDLARFVERSNGVFGKSGTGKSFFTRLLLCGIIRSGVCTNLVFDMHSEYGLDIRDESTNTFAKGLRHLFGGSKVAICSLDRHSPAGQAGMVDEVLQIGLDEIEPDDVLLLRDELRLNPTAAESAYAVQEVHGDKWLAELFRADPRELAERANCNPLSVEALQRHLQRVRRLPFVQERTGGSGADRLIERLANGVHVILEFGRHRDFLSYLLVANILSRRIYRRWVERTEKYLLSKNPVDEPRQLMIVIEEAHKFLNPEAAAQTIFGTIAREMRKYRTTLLVVDQRPSAIDREVLSQLGTRVTLLLNDDADLDAVFTGVSGGRELRGVLSTLESKEQALVMGHAVPMPLVIRTRSFDKELYRSLGSHLTPGGLNGEELQAAARRARDDLFGEDD